MNPQMNHKPRNGPISPRERDMNNSSYSNHQPHYNSQQNHSSMSPNNHQPQQANSDLINFVQGAWKEKVSCWHDPAMTIRNVKRKLFRPFRWTPKFSSQKQQTSRQLSTLTDGCGRDNTKMGQGSNVLFDESIVVIIWWTEKNSFLIAKFFVDFQGKPCELNLDKFLYVSHLSSPFLCISFHFQLYNVQIQFLEPFFLKHIFFFVYRKTFRLFQISFILYTYDFLYQTFEKFYHLFIINKI